MTFVSSTAEILQELCLARGKWGMLIGTAAQDSEEVLKAAPYLTLDQAVDLVSDGAAFLFFGSEEECYKAYYATVGDDGPTASNLYEGPARVYALTCDPGGELQTENT